MDRFITRKTNPEIKTKKRKKTYINVYTDGACINNGKKNARAGFGVYFGEDDPRNASESYTGKQTNNVAEMLGVVKALTILKEEIENGENIPDSECYIAEAFVKFAKEQKFDFWNE